MKRRGRDIAADVVHVAAVKATSLKTIALVLAGAVGAGAAGSAFASRVLRSQNDISNRVEALESSDRWQNEILYEIANTLGVKMGPPPTR